MTSWPSSVQALITLDLKKPLANVVATDEYRNRIKPIVVSIWGKMKTLCRREKDSMMKVMIAWSPRPIPFQIRCRPAEGFVPRRSQRIRDRKKAWILLIRGDCSNLHGFPRVSHVYIVCSLKQLINRSFWLNWVFLTDVSCSKRSHFKAKRPRRIVLGKKNIPRAFW